MFYGLCEHDGLILLHIKSRKRQFVQMEQFGNITIWKGLWILCTCTSIYLYRRWICTRNSFRSKWAWWWSIPYNLFVSASLSIPGLLKHINITNQGWFDCTVKTWKLNRSIHILSEDKTKLELERYEDFLLK